MWHRHLREEIYEEFAQFGDVARRDLARRMDAGVLSAFTDTHSRRLEYQRVKQQEPWIYEQHIRAQRKRRAKHKEANPVLCQKCGDPITGRKRRRKFCTSCKKPRKDYR